MINPLSIENIDEYMSYYRHNEDDSHARNNQIEQIKVLAKIGIIQKDLV